jgi:hypothetical protein
MHFVSGFSCSKITELQKAVASVFQRTKVSAGQSVSQQHEMSQLCAVRSHEHSDTSLLLSIVLVTAVLLKSAANIV